MMKINLKNRNIRIDDNGCDFVLKLDENRKETKIKLLVLTDTQFMDVSNRRPELPKSEEWDPILIRENFNALCGNQIKSLITQVRPDLLLLPGDFIHGRFDDEGITLDWFCDFMDAFEIPWAPVFGNHDNESHKGVRWQCERLTSSRYCVFKRGNVTGNSNYCIGIAVGDRLIRVIHMLDSNGCKVSDDIDLEKTAGIYPDQMMLVEETTHRIMEIQGKVVPAFAVFHIPSEEYVKAEIEKGYKTDFRQNYTLGVDVKASEGDFGCKNEKIECFKTNESFLSTFKRCYVEAVIAGHCHRINTCIDYKNIKWLFGLKTGQYDGYNYGQTGGTLITLTGERFEVQHIPSLALYGPEPERKNL